MKPAIGLDDNTCRASTSLPRNSTALGTWSAGKEPDALSKLVTGGIFHVQKLLYAARGDASLSPPVDLPLPASKCTWHQCINYCNRKAVILSNPPPNNCGNKVSCPFIHELTWKYSLYAVCISCNRYLDYGAFQWYQNWWPEWSWTA